MSANLISPLFIKSFFQKCTFCQLKMDAYDVDLASEQNIQLKKLLKTVDKSESVIHDDFSIQCLIFDMVKGMENVTQPKVSSITSEELKERAIDIAYDLFAEHDDREEIAKNLVDDFGDNYG